MCEDCDAASSHESEPEAFVEPPDSPGRRGAAATGRSFGPLEELDLAAVTTTLAEIGNRKIPGSYPETFSAAPGERLEDWKRAVQSWILSAGGQLPVEVIGVRMLAKLKDNAALVCRRLPLHTLATAAGMDLIYTTLEASPLITDLEEAENEVHQSEFLALRRGAGESMDSFTARALLYRTEMAAKDLGLAIGDKYFISHVIKGAALDKQDKAVL